MPGIQFRLLGPLEVIADGTPLIIRSQKQRLLLAALLLSANRTVSTDELIDRLWERRQPADSRSALQIHIARLRRTLFADDALGAGVIQTRPGGYLIEVSPASLDLSRFDELVEQAGRARADGDTTRELCLLINASQLWRGPALSDIHADWLARDEVPHLTETWLQAVERRYDIELELGHHTEIVGELHRLTTAYPLREKLWAQLMLTLYRCGRHTEALSTFDRVTKLLDNEIGVRPTSRLVELHRVIGQDVDGPADVRPATDASWRVQCQLPSDLRDFVGRSDIVHEVIRSLSARTGGTAVPIVVINGMPGVGKTALAVRAAHWLRTTFPDGQWFVRMQASRHMLARPADVLGHLLRASGEDLSAAPADVGTRAAAFRARLADRRVLLLLDDVPPPARSPRWCREPPAARSW